MVEQVLPLLVRDFGFALHRVEVNVVLEYACKGVVLVFDGRDGLVQHVADVVLQVFERRHKVAFLVGPGLVPAGANGHEERLAVGGLVFQKLRNQFWLVLEVGEVLLSELIPFAVELIREPLEEEHPEDEFLELGRIHLAAQNIRSLEQEGLKLSEGDLFLFHELTSMSIRSGFQTASAIRLYRFCLASRSSFRNCECGRKGSPLRFT